MSTNEMINGLTTYERILYSSMDIIGEAGLKGLSAARVAARSNISKSTVFHYFKSMEDIPGLILKMLYQEILNPIQEQRYDSAAGYLKALGHASLPENLQHVSILKAFLSLFQESMHDAKLKEIVIDCSEQFVEMIFNKLLELLDKPIERELLYSLAQLICMSLDGIAMHYLINGSKEQAYAAWEMLINTLIKQYHLQ